MTFAGCAPACPCVSCTVDPRTGHGTPGVTLYSLCLEVMMVVVFRFKLILPQSFHPLNGHEMDEEAASLSLTEIVHCMKSSMHVQLCMKVRLALYVSNLIPINNTRKEDYNHSLGGFMH